MKIVGIIAEYNPFHNGHAYHISKAHEYGDAVVVIMSGSFVQRGEPAAYDKWVRTRWALAAGADVVLELPTVYCLQSAEGFARGSIKLLAQAGCDSICFGSEYADMDLFTLAADLFSKHSEAFAQELQSNLSEGMTFAKARYNAFQKLTCNKQVLDALVLPNFILGVEYVLAGRTIAPSLDFHPIKRIGCEHNDETVKGEFASAGAIRNFLAGNSDADIYRSVPTHVADYMMKTPPATLDSLESILLYKLRTMCTEQIAAVYGVGEGLEYAIKTAAAQPYLDDVLKLIKSKRYTLARIKRILCCALLGIDKQTVEKSNAIDRGYLRLLGYRESKAELIRTIGKNVSIIARKADMDKLTGILSHMIALDCNASDVQSLGFHTKEQRLAKRDYTEKIIVF